MTDDSFYPAGAQMPLGRPLGFASKDIMSPTDDHHRPFALRFARVAAQPVPIDLTTMRYDVERQICVDSTSAPSYGKHSTGQTSTRTSDGHKSLDSDTDHTED
jgi:putative ATP-grasp target RiPP